MNVDPAKLETVRLLREIYERGGTATIAQLTSPWRKRRHVRGLLMLAAREGLVISPGSDRFSLTQKARDAIAAGEAATDEAEAKAEAVIQEQA